ncbi:MAG TPA: CoA transferase [Chloroflexota bacterium]
MSLALNAIRVLDCSTGIAGPIAAMLLADFGADVIKVEPPTGDPARSLPSGTATSAASSSNARQRRGRSAWPGCWLAPTCAS